MIFQKKVAGLTEGSLNQFVLRARKAAGLGSPVNLLVTGNSAMRVLNLRFRGKNKSTDVLSFPIKAGQDNHGSGLAGEIAISADIAMENSRQFGHSAAKEIKILALHGILHLAGWDHERDNGEMARKEAQLRRRFNLPANLIQRVENQPANGQPEPSRHTRLKGSRRRR